MSSGNTARFSWGFLILIFCALIPSALQSQPIVADHSGVLAFDEIPLSVIQTIQDDARIYYARTSHGYQLIKGLYLILDENPNYQFPYVYEYTDDLGEGGDTSWIPSTRAYLNSHPECNIAMFSWCGGVSLSTDADIYLYLAKMTELEQDYPNVTFVYMTGHLDGGGVDGDLYARNNIIRSYCLDNNKVLYDFADIESYDPDGNFYPDDNDACNWCYDWCATHSCPTPCGNDCYHTHCLNCYLKGKGLWWMMAKIYGWDSGGLSAPSNCNASTDISDYIHISWTDNADNESGYRIERDGSFLIDLPVNSTSYDDYAVNQGQQYNYTIKVYNEADTAFCDAGTGMLAGEIASPSDCAASSIYCECVRITWTDNADDESGYRIIRDGEQLFNLPANLEAINDYSAIPGHEHLYEVEAYNDHGTGFCSAGTGIRLAPPGQPTLVSPADNADDLALPVTLSWSADGTWYLCQVDEDENFVEPLITSADYLNSPQMQLTDDMERGKTYYWRVRAYNGCGVSEWSDAFGFSTEYLRMMGTIFSQTDEDTVVHETVELYKYGEFDPFKITETYCIATGQKDAGDSITMYRFDSLLQDIYSIKFMDSWVYDSVDLEDNYKCDSLNIEWTGMGWTNVEDIESEVLPESYTLFQNYPNPFNPVTRIEFTLPIESYVIIDVLNIKGELVKTLVNQNLSAGHKAVTWHGRNESGSPVSSGIYFYRLISGGVVSTKKMVLLK